jgi:hypothetical protein
MKTFKVFGKPSLDQIGVLPAMARLYEAGTKRRLGPRRIFLVILSHSQRRHSNSAANAGLPTAALGMIWSKTAMPWARQFWYCLSVCSA